MRSIKANSKDKSDKSTVEDLLREMSKKQKATKKATSNIKEIEQSLLELAEKHPEWFDGKTATFDNGQLKWVASSSPIIPDTVDLDILAEKYPSLVVVKQHVPITELRTFLNDPIHGKELRDAGLDISTTDKFQAKPN